MTLSDYQTLGRTGLRVSPFSLGTMTFGNSFLSGGGDSHEAILDRYIDQGGNFLDTANAYSGGDSETLIGRYLKARPGLRDRLVIGTKFAGNLFGGDPNGGGASRKAIMQQVEGSLRRLGTDYIDLYWQHNFDQHTPVEETIATLADFVRAGKIRYAGISDAPAWAVARMATIAELRGWPALAAIRVEYSLLERTVEGELFGAARELGLGVTPWSPLAGGLLSGKFSRDMTAPEDSNRAAFMAGRLDENTFQVLDRLQSVSAEAGAPVAAVALSWVRQQQQVTSTIIGARTLHQLDANLASLELTLSTEQLQVLSDATTPRLNFPAEFLVRTAVNWQQGGTTINGVTSKSIVSASNLNPDNTSQDNNKDKDN